jgi:hypothetical protein
MKDTPEETQLGTCARLYSEHPENTVAWARLREAAVRYAFSPAGRRTLSKLSGKAGGIKSRKRAAVEEKKKARAAWEAEQRKAP